MYWLRFLMRAMMGSRFLLVAVLVLALASAVLAASKSTPADFKSCGSCQAAVRLCWAEARGGALGGGGGRAGGR